MSQNSVMSIRQFYDHEYRNENARIRVGWVADTTDREGDIGDREGNSSQLIAEAGNFRLEHYQQGVNH